MWAQHNPRVPLGVIAMIAKVCFRWISNITINFVFRNFHYLNPSRVHIALNWYWARFGKSYQENQTSVWRKSCVWLLIAHHQAISYKPRTSWDLSMYIWTSEQNYFQNFLRQTSKFTWNAFENWCNFTVCFSSKQWHICLFFVSHLWTIKLTRSKNIFCISGRVACTIKLNIKRTFMGNYGFLQKLMLWMDCS